MRASVRVNAQRYGCPGGGHQWVQLTVIARAAAAAVAAAAKQQQLSPFLTKYKHGLSCPLALEFVSKESQT